MPFDSSDGQLWDSGVKPLPLFLLPPPLIQNHLKWALLGSFFGVGAPCGELRGETRGFEPKGPKMWEAMFSQESISGDYPAT